MPTKKGKVLEKMYSRNFAGENAFRTITYAHHYIYYMSYIDTVALSD